MIEVVINRAGITCYRLIDRPAKSRKEELEQIDLNFHCQREFSEHYDSMWHTVNESGAYGSKLYGDKLNRMGRKSGVCDWIVAVPAGEYHGLFIELKKVGKDASGVRKAQKYFIERQSNLGYKCVVAYGYKSAMQAIRDYLA